jgi:hypothetical protein
VRVHRLRVVLLMLGFFRAGRVASGTFRPTDHGNLVGLLSKNMFGVYSIRGSYSHAGALGKAAVHLCFNRACGAFGVDAVEGCGATHPPTLTPSAWLRYQRIVREADFCVGFWVRVCVCVCVLVCWLWCRPHNSAQRVSMARRGTGTPVATGSRCGSNRW